MTPQSVLLQGSVSDGPVINATVTAQDAEGATIGTTQSDNQARYSLTIPSGTALPVTLTATGGTDVVSGETPSFTLKSVSFATESATANINAYSTLAVHTARNMDGGVTPDNVNRAVNHVVRQLNFGLDTFAMPNPITTPISESNVASAVRSTEALSQMLKRSHAALQQGGVASANLTHDALIESLAADLSDGVIDGRGAAKADPRHAAVANVASAAVLVETLHNKLRVNGQDAGEALDGAIERLLPGSAARIAHAPTPALMIEQAVTVLTAVREVAPSPAIEEALQAVQNLDPAAPEELRSAFPAALESELNKATESVAVVLDPEIIDRVNDGVRDVVEVPVDPPADTPTLPACAPMAPIPALAASASGAQDGNPAAHVIDGDMTTRWAAQSMPHSVSLDLGETQLVSRTRLAFFQAEQGRVYRYSVHGSLDGETWLPVFQNRESTTEPWTVADFTGINARYLRVTLESANNTTWAGLWQAEVHGQPAAQACTGRNVTVSWAANSDEVDGYRVFAGPGATQTDLQLTDLPISSGTIDPDQPLVRYRPWEDLGMRAGENMCFRLRAYNAHGMSDWSNAVCAGI